MMVSSSLVLCTEHRSVPQFPLHGAKSEMRQALVFSTKKKRLHYHEDASRDSKNSGVRLLLGDNPNLKVAADFRMQFNFNVEDTK